MLYPACPDAPKDQNRMKLYFYNHLIISYKIMKVPFKKRPHFQFFKTIFDLQASRIFTISSLIFITAAGGCLPKKTNRMSTAPNSRTAYALAIHGGAGVITKATMTPEKEKEYYAGLEAALTLGENMLKNGSSALDVVEAVVANLEDNPLFNAGKGAVFNHDGKNEMDASIMDGATQMAGAVGAVSIIKNPIKAARAVMEKSKHVMLIGKGAEQFAKENGLDTVPPEYFYTPFRWEALQKAIENEKRTGAVQLPKEEYKFGTVGCVALDQKGNLAAATSTGGMTNKRWNRIGDSPIIGAGTYADNQSCAVSGTGHGEFFIRFTVARDIAARMEMLGESLREAADYVVMKKLVEKGGEGGVIAVDKNGNIAMPHNSPGMYRGYAKPGERAVKIYKD